MADSASRGFSGALVSMPEACCRCC